MQKCALSLLCKLLPYAPKKKVLKTNVDETTDDNRIYIYEQHPVRTHHVIVCLTYYRFLMIRKPWQKCHLSEMDLDWWS